MGCKINIEAIKPESLKVIHYPDPRLHEVSVPVDGEFARLGPLVERMFELMYDTHGVGLAAPQVGINIRLFVASPTFESSDRRVYINPRIVSAEGTQECEEGCLSVPGVTCSIKRANVVTIEAADLDGNLFQETGEGLPARIYQHETDHLDGKLLIDRMGTVAKLANRRTIRQLEDEFAELK